MRSFLIGCSLAALMAGSALAQTVVAPTAPATIVGTQGAAKWASIENRYVAASALGNYSSFVNFGNSFDVDAIIEDELTWGGAVAIGGYVPQAASAISKTRVELEGTYRDIEIDEIVNGTSYDASGEQFGLYGNAYMDFYSPYGFAPYVGAGAGAVANDFSGTETTTTNSFSSNDWAFAYQAMVGVTAPVAEKAVAKIGYRYQGFSGADIDYNGTTMDSQVDLEAGHTVDFGIMLNF